MLSRYETPLSRPALEQTALSPAEDAGAYEGETRAERRISRRMLIQASVIGGAGVSLLPLLAVEFFEADKIRAEPVLALWLAIGTSVIWLAFAVIAIEFLMATTSGRKREMEEAPLSERLMSMSPGSWVGRMTGGGVKHE